MVIWWRIWCFAPTPPAAMHSGGPILALNGLPVFSQIVWFPSFSPERFSYYFEDRDGNLHLMRAHPDTPAPRPDPSFRGRRIYPRPVLPRLAPGGRAVYYFVDAYDGLILVTVWRSSNHLRHPSPLLHGANPREVIKPLPIPIVP